MKKSMTRKVLSLMLVVMMLVSACITYTASAANLTIAVNPISSTVRGDSADASVLTDGVKEGDYNKGATVTLQGTNKLTEFVLNFSASTTVDTIKVYGAAPAGGGSWNISDENSFYSVKVNGETVATSVSVDRTNDIYPIATIALESAVTADSIVLTMENNKYCAAIYEIEAFEASDAPVVPDDSSEADDSSAADDSSEAETSEDTSADEPETPADPFDGKYFVLASFDGTRVMKNEDDLVKAISTEEDPGDAFESFIWKFELKENNTYKIVNLGTGRVLDVAYGEDNNGVAVKTWESNDSEAQRFSVSYEAVEGAFVATLFPACSTTRAVDICAETGELQLWEYFSENTNQKFIMVEIVDEDDDDTSSDDSSADDTSSDDTSSDDTSTSDEVNYAAGKKYTFESTKGFLEGYEDSGKLLTDGVVTNSEVKGQNVAVAGSGAVTDVVIDLGSKRTDIDKIVFGGVRIAGNRQFAQVTLQVSNNGRTFTTIDASKYTRIDNETGAGSYDIVFDLAEFATARYVKVSMLNDNYVLSMSEIKVIGYGAEGEVNPDDNENPGDAGIVTISIVALIALAGAVVVSKRRFN